MRAHCLTDVPKEAGEVGILISPKNGVRRGQGFMVAHQGQG